MPTSIRRHPIRRPAATVACVLCVAALLAGCRPEDRHLENLLYVNHERVSRGIRPVGWDDELAAKAASWAATLAERGALAHSDLADGVSPGWTALGENVGSGGTVLAVHRGFLGSPQHREVMLSRSYRTMGVGVVEADGVVWIVEVYKG